MKKIEAVEREGLSHGPPHQSQVNSQLAAAHALSSFSIIHCFSLSQIVCAYCNASSVSDMCTVLFGSFLSNGATLCVLVLCCLLVASLCVWYGRW